MNACVIHRRLLGLAGGIDKDGSRAAELLGLGFGSVEFGTVTVCPQAGGNSGGNAGVAALAARLAAVGRPAGAAIGVGIGLPAGASSAELARHWRAGLAGAWPVADYVSFNLSAQANRYLLAAEHAPLLAAAFAALAAARERLTSLAGRRIALAVKLPLVVDGQLPLAADLAAAAGFDRITAVRPDGEDGFERLARLARTLAGGPAVIAVGGIRQAADVRLALQAGASGVQVHRAFTAGGAGCLAALLGRADPPATENHDGLLSNSRMAATTAPPILAP